MKTTASAGSLKSTEGWGGILFVTVHSGSHIITPPPEIFEERIRSVVRAVFDDRRHVVKVVWVLRPRLNSPLKRWTITVV